MRPLTAAVEKLKEHPMKLPTISDAPPPEPPAFDGLAAVHLRTTDLDRSLRFYGGLLGLPIVRSEPAPKRRYFLALGANLLVLEEGELPQGAGPVLQLALRTADLDALEGVRKRLLEGGVPVSGLEDHGYAYVFRFRDPVNGLILQASAVARAHEPEDRFGDTAPPATAAELLGPRPG